MNTIQLQPIDEFSISTIEVARCADGNGTLTPLFFSDHVLDIARAKAICAKCALRERCLSDALEREEPWGVWGGELLSGGRIVANKRPGGRPPKRPRPPVFVDELGVVEFADTEDVDVDIDDADIDDIGDADGDPVNATIGV
jgi:WhiB family redox-sensing transcriptional regulator